MDLRAIVKALQKHPASAWPRTLGHNAFQFQHLWWLAAPWNDLPWPRSEHYNHEFTPSTQRTVTSALGAVLIFLTHLSHYALERVGKHDSISFIRFTIWCCCLKGWYGDTFLCTVWWARTRPLLVGWKLYAEREEAEERGHGNKYARVQIVKQLVPLQAKPIDYISDFSMFR